MKKLNILCMILLLSIPIFGQVKLDVEGDMKMRGQLDLISTGFANMFIGEDTGNNITSGKSNVFLGWSAGVNNSSGDDNTFVGTVAGSFSKTGSSNTFLGYGAGQFNDSGSSNTFVGRGAGIKNTEGNENTFIGEGAGGGNMTGNDNTLIGHNAGLALEAGFRNTFIGKNAGTNTTFSFNNTFLGWGAGFFNKTGTSNTFLGQEAGAFNTGSDNSFIGTSAGVHNTSGEYNTFVGNYSGEANTTGEKNTFIGYSAGNTSEDSTLTNALAIGHRSKVGCSNCAVIGGTGGNSVFVGIGTSTPVAPLDVHGEVIFRNQNKVATFRSSSKNAFISLEPNGGTDNLNIGYNNGNDGDYYYIDFPGGVFPEFSIGSGGAIFQLGSLIHSDRRFKRSIRPIDGALVKIGQLQGVTYAFDPQRFAKNATPEGWHLGLIAQEVEKVFPQLVKESPDGYKAVNYDGFIPVLIEGMKEQQQLIKDLQIKVDNTDRLEEQMLQQERQIIELQFLLEKLVLDKKGEPN